MSSVFVIAMRRYRKDGRYRTRYYRECLDARPRFVEKRKAARMGEATATIAAAQLRAMRPAVEFLVLEADAKPPRGKRDHVAPRELEQMEISPKETQCSIPPNSQTDPPPPPVQTA